MNNVRTRNLLGSVLLGALIFANANAQNLSSNEVQRRIVQRRAVDAAIWGMPIVSLHAMREGYFRDGKAKYGDIIWWPKGSAWKNQSLNGDGSVDVYFGPEAPADKKPNWIYTPAAKSWFPWFRFFGPEKPLFDKSWKMPDIEKVK